MMNKLLKISLGVLAAGAGLSVYAAKDASSPALLTKKKMGAAWPFTTESAIVGCEAGRTYVLTNGQKYGLSGLASGARNPDGSRMYADLNEVWLPDPASGPGAHKSLAAVMEAADKECSK